MGLRPRYANTGGYSFAHVSSTWRADGITRTRERLKQWGVDAECVAVTPYMNEKDPSGRFYIGVPRGREIQKWLDAEPVESFVILDDDTDMEHLMPYLIHTPFETGLTPELAGAAIEMLSRFAATESKGESDGS